MRKKVLLSEYVTADHQPFEAHLNVPLAAIAVGVGFLGIIIAYIFYKKPNADIKLLPLNSNVTIKTLTPNKF